MKSGRSALTLLEGQDLFRQLAPGVSGFGLSETGRGNSFGPNRQSAPAFDLQTTAPVSFSVQTLRSADNG